MEKILRHLTDTGELAPVDLRPVGRVVELKDNPKQFLEAYQELTKTHPDFSDIQTKELLAMYAKDVEKNNDNELLRAAVHQQLQKRFEIEQHKSNDELAEIALDKEGYDVKKLQDNKTILEREFRQAQRFENYYIPITDFFLKGSEHEQEMQQLDERQKTFRHEPQKIKKSSTLDATIQLLIPKLGFAAALLPMPLQKLFAGFSLGSSLPSPGGPSSFNRYSSQAANDRAHKNKTVLGTYEVIIPDGDILTNTNEFFIEQAIDKLPSFNMTSTAEIHNDERFMFSAEKIEKFSDEDFTESIHITNSSGKLPRVTVANAKILENSHTKVGGYPKYALGTGAQTSLPKTKHGLPDDLDCKSADLQTRWGILKKYGKQQPQCTTRELTDYFASEWKYREPKPSFKRNRLEQAIETNIGTCFDASIHLWRILKKLNRPAYLLFGHKGEKGNISSIGHASVGVVEDNLLVIYDPTPVQKVGKELNYFTNIKLNILEFLNRKEIDEADKATDTLLSTYESMISNVPQSKQDDIMNKVNDITQGQIIRKEKAEVMERVTKKYQQRITKQANNLTAQLIHYNSLLQERQEEVSLEGSIAFMSHESELWNKTIQYINTLFNIEPTADIPSPVEVSEPIRVYAKIKSEDSASLDMNLDKIINDYERYEAIKEIADHMFPSINLTKEREQLVNNIVEEAKKSTNMPKPQLAQLRDAMNGCIEITMAKMDQTKLDPVEWYKKSPQMLYYQEHKDEFVDNPMFVRFKELTNGEYSLGQVLDLMYMHAHENGYQVGPPIETTEQDPNVLQTDWDNIDERELENARQLFESKRGPTTIGPSTGIFTE